MRTYTILIPHYKTKITAYCLYKILKHSAGRVNVVVVSNSGREGLEYLEPFKDRFKLLFYPEHLTQSHGLAFDYAIENTDISEYFITLESDSFPTSDNWLDYYDNLIEPGYDMAGSKLKLSGGEYIHPAGAMYSLENWHIAKQFIENWNEIYDFYPNMLMKDEFPCHIMAKKNEWNPTNINHYHHSYRTMNLDEHLERYLPIAQSVFHNGMGYTQESYYTYGQRNIETGMNDLLKPNNDNLIYRMGYEPGQWFGYWHYATGRKVKEIPTEVMWMPNRVNQQQEYTLTENGVKHLWGVTAYGTSDAAEVQDITKRKQELMNQLYLEIEQGS